MKYWSETLNRTFDTVEALEEAETRYEARKAEERAKAEAERVRREELAEKRDERWREVRKAYMHADKLKEKYIADYYQEKCGLDGLLHLIMEI